MVKAITAYQAEDGRVFNLERAALEHDAITALKKLDVFNHASAEAVVRCIDKVIGALGPLAAYMERYPNDGVLPQNTLVEQPQSESETR